MKKGLIILALVILAVSFISANNTSTTVQDNAKKAAESLNERTEDVLLREISIPPQIVKYIGPIFGIKGTMSWQELIVIVAVFAGFLAIILSIMDFLPFLNKGVSKFLGALVITCIVSITGALTEMSRFFFNIAGFFEAINEYSTIKIIIAIILFFILVFVISYVSKILKNKMKIKTAEFTGKNINSAIKNINTIDKINKISSG
jgi:hypothetical protein